MKSIVLLLTLLPGLSSAMNSSWQRAGYPTATQVVRFLNGKVAPTEFRIAAQPTTAGAMVFHVFYQTGAPVSGAAPWQVRKAASVPEALAFINSQGAFAKTPEKEFRLCGAANGTPSFWIFYRQYAGRTPEAAKGEWNWKAETFGRAEEVHSFLIRRRDQELLTDVEITGAGDKFYVFYRAPRLYDAPGMPTPVWHWIKRESAASLWEVLNTGTDRKQPPMQTARIAALRQASGLGFYLLY